MNTFHIVTLFLSTDASNNLDNVIIVQVNWTDFQCIKSNI